jgi:hypothetical protein
MSSRFAGRRKLLGGLPAVLFAPFAGLFASRARADVSALKAIGETAATLKPVEPARYNYRVVCFRPDGSRAGALSGVFPDEARARLNRDWKRETYINMTNAGFRFEVQRRPVGEWEAIA